MTTTINDTANLDALCHWTDVTTGDAALVEVMQWRGTRDALITRVINAGTPACKALLANMDAFTYRHEPTALRKREAASSLMATMAALHWLDGNTEGAQGHLDLVPDGHTMGDLLKKLVGGGAKATYWAEQMRTVSEVSCLAFADQERAAYTAALSADEDTAEDAGEVAGGE